MNEEKSDKPKLTYEEVQQIIRRPAPQYRNGRENEKNTRNQMPGSEFG